MEREAVIVDAARTAVGKGKPGGALSGWHPVDLLGELIEASVERLGLAPELVEDVLVGCVTQVGGQSVNVGRNAALAAGLPETVPGITLDRQCGSSLQAVQFAAQGVLAGTHELVIAGGVEVMSREPMFSATLGKDPYGERVASRYRDHGGLVPQGLSSEMIAARWGLSRAELEAVAVVSHRRAVAARDAGITAREIIPVAIDRGDGSGGELFTADEGLRPDTSLATLAGLAPAFRTDELAARYPQLGWVVTAGVSSQISDGASVAVVLERRRAEALGLEPRAAIRGFTVVGDDPILMLTGVIPATQRLLEGAGMRTDDIDVFEVNEAFAPVVVAWHRELGADPERVNPLGGAIANGHPLGASGTKLLSTLLNGLDQVDGRYGVVAMCEGGGMANAMLVERFP